MKLRKDGQPRKVPVRHPMKRETKDKIASSLFGRKVENPRSGFTHSEQTKKKIASSLEGSEFTKERKDKISKANSNRIASPETKSNLSSSAKERWNRMTEEERSQFNENRLKAIKFQDSLPEIKFEKILKSKNIQYEHPKQIGRYRVDFYLPQQNMIVEIQGCYFHGCEKCGHNKDWHIKKRSEDVIRKSHLESLGYKVKFVWEHELSRIV